jgi:hypothetical protein
MWKKFQKSWPHRLWDYNIWSSNKSFFPLCPAGTADFDCPWCKFFELCNFELLHHFMHIMLGTCVPNLRGRWWLECTLHWRRVQKISITLAILVEFFVIALFHQTKILIVDMKVQVYSKFRKNKIWKKIKSPTSMRNGRFNTSKCNGEETFPQDSLFLLTTFLDWCSQLLLVGYITCSPCPYFS